MDFQPDEEIAFKRNPEVVLLDEDEEASKATVKIPADEVHSLPAAEKTMPSAEPTPRRNSVPSPVATVPSAPGQMDLWGPYPSGRSISIPCNNKPAACPHVATFGMVADIFTKDLPDESYGRHSVSVLGAQVYGIVSTFICSLLRPSQ